MNSTLWKYAATYMCGALSALVMLAVTDHCRADELINSVNTPITLGVHVASVHQGGRDEVADKPYNDFNPGAYLRFGNVAVGTYYNSIRKESFYVAYVQRITDYLDVSVGAISGYNGPGYTAKPVMPMVVPSVHFAIVSGITARLHFVPKVAKGGANCLSLSVEYSL